jgi:hypothetical protein
VSIASAERWPGDTAGLASAISAKVIGQHCAGLLSASDIRQIDAYLAKAASELAAKPGAQTTSPDGPPLHELMMRRQAEACAKKYADPTACDADTAEEAQDTLRKVRNAMQNGKPLFPDDNDPDGKPDVDEAIAAKVTDVKCLRADAPRTRRDRTLPRQTSGPGGRGTRSSGSKAAEQRSPAAGAQGIVPRLACEEGRRPRCEGHRQPTHPNA